VRFSECPEYPCWLDMMALQNCDFSLPDVDFIMFPAFQVKSPDSSGDLHSNTLILVDKILPSLLHMCCY